MGFLRKLFGGGDQDQAKKVAEQVQAPESSAGVSNEEALAKAGLGSEEQEDESSWLSRAWEGMKDFGGSLKEGAKGGAFMGSALGAAPGGALGAAAGSAVGSVGGPGGSAVGATVLGGALALPGAVLGGIVGSIAGMAKGAWDHFDADDKEILAATADIPGYHIILEQFAHIYAYGKGDMKTLDLWGYELATEFEDDKSGFRVIGLKPKDASQTDPDGQPLQPVVAFRGTKNMGGVKDDLNREGIGTFQFSRNEKEIKNTFASVGGKADTTGHSLGGALAQLAAARLGGMVGDIVTFQAAGINGDDAQKIDKDAHKATHYRTAGDLVHSGGEAFALGDVVQFEQKGIDTALSHVTQPLAQLNALRGEQGAPTVEGVRNTADDEWVVDKKGDYHSGHWKDATSKNTNRLHRAERSDDANDVDHAGIVDMIGGRKGASMFMETLAGTSNLADRQEDFAKAWKAIRGVCGNITDADQIPEIRGRVVDVVIEHGVPVEDHGKFISQAEALMIDVLEAKAALAKEAPA